MARAKDCYPFSGLPYGKCLYPLLHGGDKPCRFLARDGMYCKKHWQQWREEMYEALKHPEKWVWRNETINGKVYRDLVYKP
jgi:hypothetical protein